MRTVIKMRTVINLAAVGLLGLTLVVTVLHPGPDPASP
jgi:hypothetical protein